jgi:tetratricopeptide (TPR) repeat protein
MYLRWAGQRAFARSANKDAVSYFDQSLQALTHLPETEANQAQEVDLLIDLRNALLPLGDNERMGPVVERAVKLAEQLNDARRISATSTLKAFVQWRLGELRSGIVLGRRSLSIAKELNDLALEAPANLYLGYLYTAVGEFQKAKQHLKRNVQVLVGPSAGELFGIAAPPGLLSRMALIGTLAELGEFAEALAIEQQSARLVESINHPFATSLMYWNAGNAHAAKGDFENAIDRLETARRLVDEWGFVDSVWITASALGYCYASVGRVREALPLIEHALGFLLQKNSGPGTSFQWSAYTVSRGLLLCGRTSDAEQLAGASLQSATQVGARGEEAWERWLLGEIGCSTKDGNLTEAEQLLRQALALSEELGMRPLSAHCHLSLGRLLERTASKSDAREELACAYALYREMDMQFWLKETESALKSLPVQ